MRSPSLVALSVLLAAACTTPDREFPEDDASSTTSTSTTSSGTPTSTGGGDGDGDGDGGSGGETSAPSSSSQGGDPGPCGNGELDEGEACDEDTELCNGCQIDCPSGWFALGDSCFAVALNDVDQYDGLTADAKCGALEVGASGHRAHGATPASLSQFQSLATRCVNDGCWLGFFALGPPGDGVYTAPATGETLSGDAPWGDAEPSLGGAEICVKLTVTGDGATVLEDQPCDSPGYFACELEVSYGSFTTCHDGAVDIGEECDDEADEACVDCDRRCPAGWSEDPRSHACLQEIDALATWTAADSLCTDAGGRLATPDEIPDVRIAYAVTDDAWLGLETTGLTDPIPGWRSGETFSYTAPDFPLPADAESVGDFGALVAGEIVFDTSEGPHAALCETFDPDD